MLNVSQGFQAAVARIKAAIDDPSTYTRDPQDLALEIKAYSDTSYRGGIDIQDFLEAVKFIELIPLQIKLDNDTKGWPITYTLLPIGTLCLFLGNDIKIQHLPTPAGPIDPLLLHEMLSLFDELYLYGHQLQIYLRSISRCKEFVAKEHIKGVEHYIDGRASYPNPLALRDFEQQERAHNAPPQWFGSTAIAQLGKIEFLKMAVIKGAKTFQEIESWGPNRDLFLELLEGKWTGLGSIIVTDCNATMQPLMKTRISCYANGQETVRDLVDREDFMRSTPLAYYADGSLELNVDKPLNRRPLKVPCQKYGCSPKQSCDWHCSRCIQPLEYGFTDEYVYCDCGRSLHSKFEFRCNGKVHRKGYVAYDQKLLLERLNHLEEAECLNILILGETGVGKSTFINAFVNYLTFETLNDAKAEDLHWVVPCSFSMQHMDRTGSAKAIEEFDIKVGHRDDEVDGSKGSSATQQTTVYPVKVGSYTIRLIDTPGIGDTRGISYDKKNMADLLSTSNGYENVHGILILLKSNNSRLTVTFNFCLKELLTHLHRSAAVNMAFGFTNTRISNYTPGDTFGPLSASCRYRAFIDL